MTRLILAVVLTSVAVAGAACSDDNPVGPSSISGPAAFKNEMVFVPDPAASCTATTWRDHADRLPRLAALALLLTATLTVAQQSCLRPAVILAANRASWPRDLPAGGERVRRSRLAGAEPFELGPLSLVLSSWSVHGPLSVLGPLSKRTEELGQTWNQELRTRDQRRALHRSRKRASR